MIDEPRLAYVWCWLPGAKEPVVAGRLDDDGQIVTFTYGRSYLERATNIPLYEPELPLRRGPQAPANGPIASCIDDAGPDAWGRRVIESRLAAGAAASTSDLRPVTYLLASSSDRIGALDFQASPVEYVARQNPPVPLDELVRAAAHVEAGRPLPFELHDALGHGSSAGGAWPKALVDDGDRHLLAKFSTTPTERPVLKGEYIAMELARRVGLAVPPVRLETVLGKDVLLVERFDRPAGGGRRAMVSAKTMLALGELGTGGSYAELADLIRARFTEPDRTLAELFARITFNILVGNTDDHPRNHSAFWDGKELTLTPAYDICPQLRTGGETAQAMAIGRDGFRSSQVAGCVARSDTYHLTVGEATALADRQIEVIRSSWDEVCEQASLTRAAKSAFWERQFLNPYALYDFSP